MSSKRQDLEPPPQIDPRTGCPDFAPSPNPHPTNQPRHGVRAIGVLFSLVWLKKLMALEKRWGSFHLPPSMFSKRPTLETGPFPFPSAPESLRHVLPLRGLPLQDAALQRVWGEGPVLPAAAGHPCAGPLDLLDLRGGFKARNARFPTLPLFAMI